jgi:hypothetical protein
MAKSKKKTPTKSTAKPKAGKSKVSVKSTAARKAVKSSTELVKKSQAASPVLEYKLFCEDSVRCLEDQVNYYISKGWAPVGGVVLQGTGNYIQTMVRHQ